MKWTKRDRKIHSISMYLEILGPGVTERRDQPCRIKAKSK
jgi:hypothetical protein